MERWWTIAFDRHMTISVLIGHIALGCGRSSARVVFVIEYTGNDVTVCLYFNMCVV